MENALTQKIENRIFTIRGKQVMLDTDLSAMFSVQAKRINEQVRRNSNRFPNDFSFRLTLEEWQLLKSQIATSTAIKGGKVKVPRVFTEHGLRDECWEVFQQNVNYDCFVVKRKPSHKLHL